MNEVKRGRKSKVNPVAVAAWRQAHNASIAETATRFGISATTVKDACRTHGEEAREARARWRGEREDQEAGQLEYASRLMETNLAHLREADERASREPWNWDAFLDVLDAANRVVPREYRNKKPGER